MIGMILLNSGEGISVNTSTALSIYPCISVSTLPSIAYDNDIAVITTEEITNWCIQPEEPTSPTEGALWIVTRDGAYAWFNIGTASAPILIHPAGIYQYVNGAWVYKDSYIWQNNDWMQIVGYIYNAGEEYDVLTGGWQVLNASNGTGVKNADNIYLSFKSSSARNSSLWSIGLIDVTPFNKLCFQINISTATNQLNVGLATTNNTTGTVPGVINAQFTTTGLRTASVDISEFTGNYYIGFYANATNVNIYKIWFE